MCIRDVHLVFFFSSRRRHTRQESVSWARRCVQETVLTQDESHNISLKLDSTSFLDHPEGAGDCYSLDILGENQYFLGLENGRCHYFEGSVRKCDVDVKDIYCTLMLNDSLLIVGDRGETFALFTVKPEFKLQFKGSIAGSGILTSGCFIDKSDVVETPLLILTFVKQLSVLNLHGSTLLNDTEIFKGDWPRVRVLLRNMFVGVEDTYDSSNTIYVMQCTCEEGKPRVEKLSFYKPLKIVRQVECYTMKGRICVVYGGNEEMGILAFHESSQLLVPQARVDVSGVSSLKALSCTFINDYILVIFTYSEKAIYHTIYDILGESFSSTKKDKEDKLEGRYTCDKQIVFTKREGQRIEFLVNAVSKIGKFLFTYQTLSQQRRKSIA
eukprot:TRINITY_DN12380_c0_g1_i6.p1 TRINITY_DN12380_c0_g1~~TRINITY_DN12380_c0_g1_i6.p1  ORF type:complete len:383 (-),score=46.47 TRINITY_DN12380_c0_g1_i6:174-1322(-)